MVNLGLFTESTSAKSANVTFRIPYFTQWGQSVLLCGSKRVLGSWNVKKGLLLSPFHLGDELIWAGSITVPTGVECEYNYYVVDDQRNVLRWEVGNKRKLLLPDGVQGGEVVEFHDLWQNGSDTLPFRSAFKDVIFRRSCSLDIERPTGTSQNKLDKEDSVIVQFRICCPNIEEESAEMPWRGAGVAIPMFSIRSEANLGVGEFLDLKLLVDWAVDSGFHLVQLLPINDTSVHRMWWDSYPYSSLSVFALHPLYLRVEALSESIPEAIKQEIQKARLQLEGKDVDYEATMATKLSIAKKIFLLEKDLILNSSSFQTFFLENEDWLKPYAAFCFLRDFFETSEQSQWGRFSHFSKDKLEKLISKDSCHYDIIRFHYYLQFHLHLQLSEAAEYARKKGVVLKGDLPIGVDRNSVDTWVNPNLFRMNTSTGAPPDYFDKNGQNWGFPTYNWEEMSKDNYAWWRARLTQMAKYFTAYRIDHILGFFRIWELPEHAMTGLVGKFRPSIPLSQEELEREGIWDFDRLSLPYILQEFLQDKFGPSWTVIASSFMNECGNHRYQFREDCNTEKKIASKLKSCMEKSLFLESEDELRRILFRLLQNIVLIRDPEDPTKFYPRFNIEDTSSFKHLDEHSKNVLKRLYYDYYFHRQENLWRQNALKTLPVLLNSSDMLACGEDLGLIPSCVHPVMQELGLIGLRIQRMPSEPDLEFGIPSQYSYMTVCAPSCHDCSTLRAWWEEDEERRTRFFKTMVGSDKLPPAKCVPEVAYFILRQHVEAPSMWAIFPLQDLLALKEEYTARPATEETINDPTNPKHYWRFRVHVTMELLLKDKELKTTIKDLIRGSGRSYPPSREAEVHVGHEKVRVAPEKQQVSNGQDKVALTSQLNGIPTSKGLAVL
ncbi:hypothetical protein RJ639_038973 [Escallonia herrerae]|uniref:4-alpha-glucanotransferase n=1 Tax=Escallonia herrerae TaxID=1293975 RepID=A0AA88WS31_9ASTE|nr:hypothetical protein RJ639_038973 [Escallonia herrerae]